MLRSSPPPSLSLPPPSVPRSMLMCLLWRDGLSRGLLGWALAGLITGTTLGSRPHVCSVPRVCVARAPLHGLDLGYSSRVLRESALCVEFVSVSM